MQASQLAVPPVHHSELSMRSALLTGATGFVGRFLLARLLEDSDAMIYCLVRAESKHSAAVRIRSNLTHWGLWRPDYERRIVAIPSDLRARALALGKEDYQSIVGEVDCIFHCGASVNHLETYETAKAANVLGTNELLKIAAHGKGKPFHHISTLGVFARSDLAETRVVSEDTPIEHERHRQSNGYAASKWIAEGLILTAQKEGIPCNIYRLGLLWADSRRGRFDEQQHVYRLLKSCVLSGYGIEGFHYDQDPVPVDYAARAIAALALRPHSTRNIFHITSHVQEREGLFERCNRTLDAPLTLMPHYDWICEIKRLYCTGQMLPIVPLIEYAFSMGRNEFAAHRNSEELRRLNITCEATCRELAQAGIAPPRFNQDLIEVCLERMLLTDEELGNCRAKGKGIAAL